MTSSKGSAPAKAKVADLEEKAGQARAAANSDGASKRDKADLKLLEQEVAGEKMRRRHPPKPVTTPTTADAKLDKALKDSFPGSDPVSFVQAAPVKEGDLPLSTVDSNRLKDGKKKGS